MLNKSILLNLQIGWKNFQIVFGLGLSVLLLSLLPNFFAGLILQIPLMLIATYFSYKGLYDMFWRSVFGEGSLTYMTLPFSAKDMVTGKIIASTLYLFSYNILFLVIIILSTLTTSGPMAFPGLIFTELFTTSLAQINTNDAIFLTLIAALLPLVVLASQASINALLLMLMVQLNLKGNGKGRLWAFIIFFGLNYGINQVSPLLLQWLLPKGIWPFLPLEITLMVLLAAGTAIMSRITENSLKYRYNG